MALTTDPVKEKFPNEVDLEIHARQVILSQDDPEELICSQVGTLNRNSLRSANSGKYTSSLFLVNLTLWFDVDHQKRWTCWCTIVRPFAARSRKRAISRLERQEPALSKRHFRKRRMWWRLMKSVRFRWMKRMKITTRRKYKWMSCTSRELKCLQSVKRCLQSMSLWTLTRLQSSSSSSSWGSQVETRSRSGSKLKRLSKSSSMNLIIAMTIHTSNSCAFGVSSFSSWTNRSHETAAKKLVLGFCVQWTIRLGNPFRSKVVGIQFYHSTLSLYNFSLYYLKRWCTS